MAETTFDDPRQWVPMGDSFIFDIALNERDDALTDVRDTSHPAEQVDLSEEVFGIAAVLGQGHSDTGSSFHATRSDFGGLEETFSARGGGGGNSGDGGPKVKDVGKGGGGGNSNKGGGGNDGTVLTNYLSGGEESTSYNIEIIFDGAWTVALQQAFIDAADYLSTIILGDLTDMLGSETSGGGTIDDIQITASLNAIDGPGGILGQAGPSYVRLDTWLPSEGAMEFDIADADAHLSQGTWADIVLHEMLHTIGFGSIWNVLGLTTGSIAEGDLRFTGTNATLVYQSEFSTTAASDPDASLGVPIETDGGLGTAGGHWDEAMFDSELMTGYIDGSNYLSDMTIAALEDMGYETVFENALIA